MIAALWFRQFSLQAYLRSHAARAGDLLGMVETTGYSGSSSLLSVSESAAELGIRPGMTVAQGRLRGADLRIIERSVRAESDTRAMLAHILSGYSPVIELGDGSELGWAYLDLSGLERLFGSYGALRGKLLEELEQQKLRALCGMTLTRSLARALTLGGGGLFESSSDALRAIESMPLDVLEPSPELRAIWIRFGVRRVRDFLALPLDSISEHMGEEALLLYRLAIGEETGTGVLANPQTCQFVADAYFEDALQSIAQVVACLGDLVMRLVSRLSSRGYFCGDLELRLSYDGKGSHVCRVGVGEPTRNVTSLIELCRLSLEAAPPEDAIGHVLVRADPVELEPRQLSLFEMGERRGNAELEVTLAQLRALCGDDMVGMPALRDSYEEDSFDVCEFGVRAQVAEQGLKSSLSMGLRRYRPPRSLRVRLVGQSPAMVMGDGFGGRVTVCRGPFRANTEWWHPRHSELDDGSIRDIYDVRLSSGVMYRLAHCYPQDTWWALGWYD